MLKLTPRYTTNKHKHYSWQRLTRLSASRFQTTFLNLSTERTHSDHFEAGVTFLHQTQVLAQKTRRTPIAPFGWLDSVKLIGAFSSKTGSSRGGGDRHRLNLAVSSISSASLDFEVKLLCVSCVRGSCVRPHGLQWVTLGIELRRSGSASATGEPCQVPAHPRGSYRPIQIQPVSCALLLYAWSSSDYSVLCKF